MEVKILVNTLQTLTIHNKLNSWCSSFPNKKKKTRAIGSLLTLNGGVP